MTRYTARFIHEVHRRRTLPSVLRPLRHVYYDTYLTLAYLLVKVRGRSGPHRIATRGLLLRM